QAQPTLVISQGSIGGSLSLEEISIRAAPKNDSHSDGEVREGDPHVIFFTSGSTGRSKGVVLSHRANFLRSHPGALPEPRGAAVCPYPLFHMGGWTIALQQWAARDAVVFVEPDAAQICDAVERHRATRLHGIADDAKLRVRSPLLSGRYFHDPGATAAPLGDGWFRTGDLAARDDDG